MARMPPVKVDLSEGAERRIGLTGHELITGHGSQAYVLLTGFLAGILIWIPVFIIFYFNRLLVSGSSTRVSIYGGGLGIDPAALLPYIIATGIFGVGLAALRRLSARIGWYKVVASQRMGLNGAVASALGALLCIGLIVSGSQAGLILVFVSIGVIFGGYIVNSLWEGVHNLLLIPYGANPKRSDRVLERAIRHELERQPDIRPTEIGDVTVQNGRARLQAFWKDIEMRREAEQAIREMTGIVGVDIVKNE